MKIMTQRGGSVAGAEPAVLPVTGVRWVSSRRQRRAMLVWLLCVIASFL